MSGDGPTTLRAAARYFWTRPSPRVIATYLGVLLVARAVLARWTWIDLVPPVGVLLLEPFTEWVIHVVVLHWRPRHLGGHTIDLYAARKHRRHHATPRDLSIVFVPFRLLLLQVPVLIVLGVIVLPTRIGLTLGASAMAMLLTYEWTHFLVHAPYVPRSAWYRTRWRIHRLHHYRNEHYWYGVTTFVGDRALGTYPDKGEVELSETVRDLGVGTAS